MWFKTRVGLTNFGEGMPIDILVGNHGITGSDRKRWYIYARVMSQQEGSCKSLLGSATWSNPVLYLAMFSEGEGLQHSIAECMGVIEGAMRAGASVCDLSGAGDAAAWSENWKQVQWGQ